MCIDVCKYIENCAEWEKKEDSCIEGNLCILSWFYIYIYEQLSKTETKMLSRKMKEMFSFEVSCTHQQINNTLKVSHNIHYALFLVSSWATQ